MDVFADGVDIFYVLFDGVGVVKAQVACATEFFGDSEVHADCLGMTYVEVAVWFGRETGVEPAAVFAGLKIFEHKLLYKAESLGFLGCGRVIIFHCSGYIVSFCSI